MPKLAGSTLLGFALALAPTHAADEFCLEKHGGAMGQNLELSLTGEPGRPYWILFDCEETVFELAPDVILYVGFDHLALSAELPGFMGNLDGVGRASASVQVPDAPFLDGLTLSFQALHCDAFDVVTNLARVTPAPLGSFADTLGDLLPLSSGVAVPDGSDFLLIDATLPIVQRYNSNLEEFELTGLSCAVGLLSSSSVLEDGRVFTSGGLQLVDGDPGQPTDLAVLFDPVTGDCQEFTLTLPRAGHASALTEDGKVLITGGFSNFDLTDPLALFAGITNTTELFDPETGTFIPGPNILEPKAFHTATASVNGKILVSGGITLVPVIEIPLVSPTAYVYVSSSNSFEFLPGFMAEGRMLHAATLLDDGRILMAGGLTIDFEEFLQTGDIADLALNSLDTGVIWTDRFLDTYDPVEALSAGKAVPGIAALPGNRALVTGGLELLISGDISEWVIQAHADSDLFENDAFSPTGSLATARICPLVVPLPDGTVLVTGGAAGAEVFHD